MEKAHKIFTARCRSCYLQIQRGLLHSFIVFLLSTPVKAWAFFLSLFFGVNTLSAAGIHCSGLQHVLPHINMQCSDVNQVRYVHCDFMPSVSSKATWIRHTLLLETSLVAQVALDRANNKPRPLFSLSLLQKLLCN